MLFDEVTGGRGTRGLTCRLVTVTGDLKDCELRGNTVIMITRVDDLLKEKQKARK